MKTVGDRAPGPNRTVCECGVDIPPPTGITDMWRTMHRARHLDWQHPNTLSEWRGSAEAWREAYEDLYRYIGTLRVAVYDRDLRLAALEEELGS